jgi:hypothetical protein
MHNDYANPDKSARLVQDHPDYSHNTTFFRMNGTSMATAVASGVVALMLQAHPEWSPDQVKFRLMATARPAVAEEQLVYNLFQQGMGRIWAADAVLSADIPADGEANYGMDIVGDLAHGTGWVDANADGLVQPEELDPAEMAYHYQGPVRKLLSDDGQAFMYYIQDATGEPTGLGVAWEDGLGWVDRDTLTTWADGWMTWAGGWMTWAGGWMTWAGGWMTWAGGWMTWAGGWMTWAGGWMTWAGGWMTWAGGLSWADSMAWAGRMAWAGGMAWAGRMAWAGGMAWAGSVSGTTWIDDKSTATPTAEAPPEATTEPPTTPEPPTPTATPTSAPTATPTIPPTATPEPPTPTATATTEPTMTPTIPPTATAAPTAEPTATTQPGIAMCPRSVSLDAVADTYINADRPDENKGTVTTLLTKPESSKEKHALLRFDLSSVPTDATLQSADLLLTSNNSRSNHDVQIRALLTPFSESGATWNSPDGSARWAGGAAFGTADYDDIAYGVLNPVGGDTQLAVDVTALVGDWHTGSRPNFGLILLATNVDTGDAKWYSREEEDIEQRPQLTIRYLEPVAGGCSETSTLAPVADAYIDAHNPALNEGDNTRVKTRPESGEEKYGLVRFDLSGVPSGAVIHSATLQVVSKNGRSNHSVEIVQLMTAWSEMSVTWNSPDGTHAWVGGGAFSSADYGALVYGTLIPVGGDTPLSVDVTALVDAWVNGDAVNHGFLLRATGTDTGDAEWYSREEGNAARHPVLVVDWTLLPSN